MICKVCHEAETMEGKTQCPECKRKNQEACKRYYEKHREEILDARKLYYEAHRAAGLCVDCDEPTENGKARCEYHAKKMNESVRRWREKPENRDYHRGLCREAYRREREYGKCVKCRKRLAREDGLMCADCRRESVKYQREYTKIHRDEINEKSKAKRLERRAAGLCTRCGAPTVDGKAMCEKCHEYNKAYRIKRELEAIV